MKKVRFDFQFQFGFLVTITNWYKGCRDIVISIPFCDISIKQIQKKYR